ncbi:hypothetical protein [Alkalihalobacillus sp. BA299]|uniref:hypothetical protein n=1 Tax=Alkalihalobacillus sp. BA299 TaxID=2815938 RepID=UPI001ADBFF2C|nr:hypothetical protein [Alkalihalobacillus sp. BA299]
MYPYFYNPYQPLPYYGYKNKAYFCNGYPNQAPYQPLGYHQNQIPYPSPSELLVYGPYQEGPSSQMIPPEWFQQVYGSRK